MTTRLHPYLSFDGNCAEAFAFYNQAIADNAGRVEIRTHASALSEMGKDPEWHDKVLHAQFLFEDLALFGSDNPPAHRVAPNAMVNLSLHLEDTDRAEVIFRNLCAGGEVFTPLAETFWAPRFGMLRDRYGFSWMISVSHA